LSVNVLPLFGCLAPFTVKWRRAAPAPGVAVKTSWVGRVGKRKEPAGSSVPLPEAETVTTAPG